MSECVLFGPWLTLALPLPFCTGGATQPHPPNIGNCISLLVFWWLSSCPLEELAAFNPLLWYMPGLLLAAHLLCLFDEEDI
jgi:hypothetical protein